MFHQQTSASGSSLQRGDLLIVESGFLTGRLILHQCFVYFHTCVQQCLFKAEAGFFLLCLRYFQLGDIHSLVK